MKNLFLDVHTEDMIAIAMVLPLRIDSQTQAAPLATAMTNAINAFCTAHPEAAEALADTLLRELLAQPELKDPLLQAFDAAVDAGIATPIEP